MAQSPEMVECENRQGQKLIRMVKMARLTCALKWQKSENGKMAKPVWGPKMIKIPKQAVPQIATSSKNDTTDNRAKAPKLAKMENGKTVGRQNGKCVKTDREENWYKW